MAWRAAWCSAASPDGRRRSTRRSVMTADAAAAESGTETARHETSLAVWDIPAAAAAGEHFTVKAGVKSQAAAKLGGGRIEVLDGAGRVVAAGVLGPEPWPGTDGLYWSEIELRAPQAAGLTQLSVRYDADSLDAPHESATQQFAVAVVPPPEHVLTVTVAADDGPLADAIVRAGPVRVTTDAEGRARLHLAKGAHQIAVWKMGYDSEPVPLTIEADAALAIAARPKPEDNPDAIWTA